MPVAGVYVLAYMGKVLYVGRSVDVADRMRQHLTPAVGRLLVDWWLQGVGQLDAENVRLDVLEAPASDGWMPRAEGALIAQLRPLFNVATH